MVPQRLSQITGLILLWLGSLALPIKADERPKHWAPPVKMEGTPNLHQVRDTLYRSAQPTATGFQALAKQGIRTIINLRSFHSDRKKIGDLDLQYEHIFMKAWHAEDHEVVRFLKIVSDPKKQPVLVHCQHGADRTGNMCAIYRVAIQGWTKDEAIREMKEGGYGHHRIFKNLERYIRKLDVKAIKATGRPPPLIQLLPGFI